MPEGVQTKLLKNYFDELFKQVGELEKKFKELGKKLKKKKLYELTDKEIEETRYWINEHRQGIFGLREVYKHLLSMKNELSKTVKLSKYFDISDNINRRLNNLEKEFNTFIKAAPYALKRVLTPYLIKKS